MEAQSFAVKRAEVEFHNFASLGQPERAMAHYATQNRNRGAVIRNHLDFIGEMTPFLEIGSNVGHSSYMLANEFGASGFALDISADSLRHGMALQDEWGLSKAPIRVAGDAVNLPFADGSLRFVAAFQMLSQFMKMEAVFEEVKRVLAPGGIFLFAEEPLKRMLTLRLYRCPYYDSMKPWERKLYDWGLLGYLVRDVIGAHQEESFGIRQNHTMGLKHWNQLVHRYFEKAEYEIFVPERGWGERVVKRMAIGADPYRSEWSSARLLGGTLAAICRKAGAATKVPFEMARFEAQLRCPDCKSSLARDASSEALKCGQCGYSAANEGGVYNLLPAVEKAELYPGDREDIIDFSLPSHEKRLLGPWYELEGVFGNKYRWIGADAAAHLTQVKPGPQRLRVRGHAQEGHPVELRAVVNGREAGHWKLDRPGLFVVEADLPEATEYQVAIHAGPVWEVPTDDRVLTVSLSMIRLVPAGE
ncbi:MAG TPA: class I SAM-dependent methyltransferase [Bryobacteraceae bacterium]|nr:class I SAM-dependent methyltransferase [Bryobacteraceae bacterium]